MTYPHRPPGPPRRVEPERRWTVNQAHRPPQAVPLTRRYEVSWLDRDGSVADMTRVAPAIPGFESAFASLARGAIVATDRGGVAIEDLLPGTLVQTREGLRPVRWIGRILLPPANLRQEGSPDIYRVSAEAFGTRRPMPDLVLCSNARILHRAARLAALHTGPDVLVPIGDFADGVQVTQIAPMSAVTVYHFALDRHGVVDVNGIWVESFHPGREFPEGLAGDYARLFLSLFPYLGNLTEFGQLSLPRIGLDGIEEIAERSA